MLKGSRLLDEAELYADIEASIVNISSLLSGIAIFILEAKFDNSSVPTPPVTAAFSPCCL